MRILYDYQIFSLQRYGGVSRYFYEIISRIADIEDVEIELPLLVSDNHYINQHSIAPASKFLPDVNFRGRQKIVRFLNRLHCSRVIKKGDFDILHPTYYDPYFLDHINGRPIVLTIYDMIHELFCEKFPQYNDSIIYNKRILAKAATRIIAISENTKKDIIRIYGIDEKKIKVIYLGNSLVNDGFCTVPGLPSRYILYIGDRWAYKNFEYFLKSIVPMLKKDKDLYLVCGGSHPFNKNEIRLLEYYRCENRVLHVKASDNATLIGLYKNALAFVFPSLYEGFGIPVLESFSCGCPVVLSNSSSFPEVAGEAGVYFNPEDETSIRQAIKNVIYNDQIRGDMIKKGYKQLNKFSWEKTAFETRKVYESVL